MHVFPTVLQTHKMVSFKKNKLWGLERWLSDEEFLLLLGKAWVVFPEPKLGRWEAPVTPAKDTGTYRNKTKDKIKI